MSKYRLLEDEKSSLKYTILYGPYLSLKTWKNRMVENLDSRWSGISSLTVGKYVNLIVGAPAYIINSRQSKDCTLLTWVHFNQN